MKFGKEFTSQMVQEWQQAYMDYNTLKTILKDIMSFRQRNMSTPITSNSKSSLKRKVSLYRAFSGLTTRYRNSPRKRDDETILVGPVHQGGPEERYQTMFLMSSDEGGEQELVFFRKLDEEFNKVVGFYRKKVEEVVEEADELTRQMNVLIALRIKVENPNFKPRSSPPNVEAKRQEGKRMDVIHEEGNGVREMEEFKPAPLEILDHVKINVSPETPKSTIKGILTHSSSSDLSFSKEELRRSEELITKAFVEFYQKLRLLKNYCFLNQLAFSKIMKKYDKISTRSASKAYLDMVDKSYLGSCDEVTKLMERVEAAFVKHFSNGNRGSGMNILRPKQKKEKHSVTFLFGLFTGCAIALIVTIFVIIQSRKLLRNDEEGREGRDKYMANIFPLYALFGFIVLHMIMFSSNIFFWRHYRINYPFIFGLKEGTDIGYRQVFLLSSILAVVSLAGVVSNLEIDTGREDKKFKILPELLPLILLIGLILIMICPFNIIYRSTRFFLIQCSFRSLLAPLYKVTLADFFFADQLTSQVQAIRSVPFYVCYYIWGNFRTRDNKCLDSDVYKIFYLVVGIIPFWMRFFQCLRRLIEEKGGMHALNGGKYLSIIIALSARTILEQRRRYYSTRNLNPSILDTLKIIATATSGFATIYATAWDIIVDWGLLRRNSKNRWLRDKLIVPNKIVYFVAIILNCALRVAWMQSVMGLREAPFIHRKAMIALVACLEIIRRGIWNFFRLENEHLNNVGKYRAFKSVPLPFHYTD